MSLTVLCPTRGRPGSAFGAFLSMIETSVLPDTEMVMVVDRDDVSLPDYSRFLVSQRPLKVVSPEHAGGMVNALNAAAEMVLSWPEAPAVLGFIGDDHRFRTKGWDETFTAFLAEHPGFVYGDDRFWPMGEIPTQIFITADIVRSLGWMGLPGCDHLYIDNAWRELGEATDSLAYFPDVVVEHMHPSAGKTQWDDSYRLNNSEARYAHDREAYVAWRTSERFVEDSALARRHTAGAATR